MCRSCIVVLLLGVAACGGGATGGDAGTDAARDRDAAMPDAAPVDGGSDAGIDAGTPDAGMTTGLEADRDRLLATYLAFLRAHPDDTQSNGLRGRDLSTVCELWSHLDPSSQATFLTLTARLGGTTLGSDGSLALDHVTTLYRCVGGQGATATDPGSCGGGEYNRMIVSTDAALHAALVGANDHHGAAVFDLADIPAGMSWRDSHDLAGPHTPFDLSDETNSGAPRGQVQFFRDPTSARAGMPLGRMDLATLVDPYALEVDQDYDCAHNSNPTCAYTFYGAACFPAASKTGVALYGDTYGAVDVAWRPSGC